MHETLHLAYENQKYKSLHMKISLIDPLVNFIRKISNKQEIFAIT
jgi:hypothetical protein